MNKPKTGRLTILFVVLGIVVVILMLKQAGMRNQVEPPIPTQPAPVIPELPNIAASLREMKTMAEARGKRGKEMHQSGRLSKEQISRGRRLYEDAKGSHDASIEFLCVGLTRRFNDEDPQQIKGRLEGTRDKVGKFIKWVNDAEDQEWGASNPWDILLNALSTWLNDVSRKNDEAIRELQKQLRDCQLKDWPDL